MYLLLVCRPDDMQRHVTWSSATAACQ